MSVEYWKEKALKAEAKLAEALSEMMDSTDRLMPKKAKWIKEKHENS